MKAKLLRLLGLVLVLVFLYQAAEAQKKPSEKEKEEMEKMIQELDPEEIEMMGKMGIKIPDMKTLDMAYSVAWEEVPEFPERDETRISLAKKTTLKGNDLKPYLENVHASVSSKLGKTAVANTHEMLVNVGSNAEKAQIANGLWMVGSTAYAILVLGNAVKSEPENPDYLNNYAAFLTMTGAEESALPILNYLNSIYPKNSTVLNNIAQAWFGLGDISMAEAYLDSTLAIYPGHSQTNLTKSVIAEKKGNEQDAAKALKASIKSGYSQEKERKLNDLGYKVSPNELSWEPPLNEDPLGLVHMNWPKYPQNVFESEFLEKEWELYRRDIHIRAEKLNERISRIIPDYEKLFENPMSRFAKNMGNEGSHPITQMVFSRKIQAWRKYYEETEGKLNEKIYDEIVETWNNMPEKLYLIEQKYGEKYQQLIESSGKKIGEGSSEAERRAYCESWNEISNGYLKEVNGLLESENNKSIDYWRKKLSREMNYNQYTLMEQEFELVTLNSQQLWLSLIGGQEVKFTKPCSFFNYDESDDPQPKELADFYDFNCNYKSTLNLFIGTITVECNKMITQLDSKFFKYTMKENLDTDQIIKGSVEFGFDMDLAQASKLGPVKAELKGEIYGFIEFDSKGISDVGVKAGTKATLGSNLVSDSTTKASLGFADDKSTTLIGAEARWGWNSGPSLEGKGILAGLSTLNP